MQAGEVSVSVRAELSSFQRGMDQARRQSQAFERTTQMQANRAGAAWGRFSTTATTGLRNFGRGLGAAQREVLNFRTAIAGLAGAMAIGNFIRMADTMTLVSARLRIVTDDTAELARVEEELFRISQDTRTSFDATATLFQRVARGRKELGRSTEEILRFTETIQQLVVVSGATAEESRNAIIQLAQGLASGQVRGEELRSVMEQLPAVALAAAEGMNMTLGQFREASLSGEVQARDFFDAIMKGAGDAADQFSSMERTVGQSLQQLRNQWMRTVGAADDSSEATREFITALDDLREAIASPEFTRGLADIASGFGFMARNLDLVASAGSAFIGLRIGAAFGPLGAVIGGVAGAMGAYALASDDATESTDALSRDIRDLTSAAQDAWNDPSFRNVMRILVGDVGADFLGLSKSAEEINRMIDEMVNRAAKADRILQNTGGGSDRGGGGGDGDPQAFLDTLDNLRKEAELIGVRTRALDMSAAAAARLEAEYQALNDLQEENVTLTDAQRQALDQQLDSVATAAERYEQLRQATEERKRGRQAVEDLVGSLRLELDILRATDPVQRELILLREDMAFATEEERREIEELIRARVRERQAVVEAADAQKFFEDVSFDALDSLIVQGDDAIAVMERLAKTIASAALEAALLGSGPLAGAFGGPEGGLFGALFASAKGNVLQNGNIMPFAQGGVVDRPAVFPMAKGVGLMGEAGPEAIMPLKRMPGGQLGVQAKSGQTVSINFAPVIDARGADAGVLPRIEQMLEEQRKAMIRDLPRLTRQAQSRGALF